MNFIQKHGVEKFIEQQERRIRLLETMLKSFDDGRSKSFYCIATTLLPITDLETSLDKAERRAKKDDIESDDYKAKSKILKGFLNEFAVEKGIELKLRKKVKAKERR